MAKKERGKTVFAVSHGAFLHFLVANLQQATNDRLLMETKGHIPENNSLTIIDFDVEERQHFKGTGMVTSVLPRLVAHNLQIIQNLDASPMDYEP